MKHRRDIEFVAFERLHCRIVAYYRKHIVRIGKNCICILLTIQEYVREIDFLIYSDNVFFLKGVYNMRQILTAAIFI